MTSSELARQVYSMVEARVRSTPSSAEFEMAYQARVAIDRIRFAIKHTEQFCSKSDALREAGLQLLDALDRLQEVDRRFQRRSRMQPEARNGNRAGGLNANQIGRDCLRNGGPRPEERQAHA